MDFCFSPKYYTVVMQARLKQALCVKKTVNILRVEFCCRPYLRMYKSATQEKINSSNAAWVKKNILKKLY